MSRYKAIFFDLDGTAVANSPTAMPSERLMAAVAAHRTRIHLIATTGRPLKFALPVIQALELTDLCILSGGTIIMDPVTQDIIQHTNIPAAAVRSILDLAKQHPYKIALRDEYVDPTEDHQAIIENIEIIYLSRIPDHLVPAMLQALAQIPDIATNVVPDWTGQHNAFNITHINATKEHAVAEVLERLGVRKEEAIGVGDGNNDLHLFRSVGLKVAMGNATPELKAAADLIAPPQDQDGLADIIERYA